MKPSTNPGGRPFRLESVSPTLMERNGKCCKPDSRLAILKLHQRSTDYPSQSRHIVGADISLPRPMRSAYFWPSPRPSMLPSSILRRSGRPLPNARRRLPSNLQTARSRPRPIRTLPRGRDEAKAGNFAVGVRPLGLPPLETILGRILQ